MHLMSFSYHSSQSNSDLRMGIFNSSSVTPSKHQHAKVLLGPSLSIVATSRSQNLLRPRSENMQALSSASVAGLVTARQLCRIVGEGAGVRQAGLICLSSGCRGTHRKRRSAEAVFWLQSPIEQRTKPEV